MNGRLPNRRIRLLILAFAVVFAIAFARAAWLQAVRAPSLGKLASSQQRETITLPARRGTIYDRLGIELAIGEQATTVWANPRQIADPRNAAVVAAGDLGLDPATVFELLADRSRGFVYVKRKWNPEKAKMLELRGIAGLGFYSEEKREYPQKRVASSAIGFAGTDNRGLAGLELEYDDVLAGKNGRETIVRDPAGQTIDVIDPLPVREGHNLVLTLDYRLQAQVERVLRETRANWGAKAATAVVLDPRTGGVLAMAVAPGFDANRFAATSPDVARGRAVTDTFEPGSTFKVVTVAAALEEGIVTPRSAFTLPYVIRVSDRAIHDAEPRGTERMTVAKIVERSSNVGVITLALKLGDTRLATWIDRFGFGRPTGIDFPGESGGIVLPLEKWSGSTIGNVPIGQGIAVTPLQMASVYAAIANRGKWVQPHLVQRVVGARDAGPRVRRRRIISRWTAKRLSRMLTAVVERGSGTEAQVPGYTVAGKTGTAAKPEPGGGYSDTRYVASFVGFVPARRPRLVVSVTVDEPRGAIYGGKVAAPAFARIAQFALQYLDVPPDAPRRPY